MDNASVREMYYPEGTTTTNNKAAGELLQKRLPAAIRTSFYLYEFQELSDKQDWWLAPSVAVSSALNWYKRTPLDLPGQQGVHTRKGKKQTAYPESDDWRITICVLAAILAATMMPSSSAPSALALVAELDGAPEEEQLAVFTSATSRTSSTVPSSLVIGSKKSGKSATLLDEEKEQKQSSKRATTSTSSSSSSGPSAGAEGEAAGANESLSTTTSETEPSPKNSESRPTAAPARTAVGYRATSLFRQVAVLVLACAVCGLCLLADYPGSWLTVFDTRARSTGRALLAINRRVVGVLRLGSVRGGFLPTVVAPVVGAHYETLFQLLTLVDTVYLPSHKSLVKNMTTAIVVLSFLKPPTEIFRAGNLARGALAIALAYSVSQVQ